MSSVDKIGDLLGTYYFTHHTIAGNLTDYAMLAIGVYGIGMILLYIIRHIILYRLYKAAMAMADLVGFKNNNKNEDAKPTEREDELLRHEEKERKKEVEVEKVRVEVIKKKKKQEEEQGLIPDTEERIVDFVKPIGKFTNAILGAKARDMASIISSGGGNKKKIGYWTAYIEARNAQSGRIR